MCRDMDSDQAYRGILGELDGIRDEIDDDLEESTLGVDTFSQKISRTCETQKYTHRVE